MTAWMGDQPVATPQYTDYETNIQSEHKKFYLAIEVALG